MNFRDKEQFVLTIFDDDLTPTVSVVPKFLCLLRAGVMETAVTWERRAAKLVSGGAGGARWRALGLLIQNMSSYIKEREEREDISRNSSVQGTEGRLSLAT